MVDINFVNIRCLFLFLVKTVKGSDNLFWILRFTFPLRDTAEFYFDTNGGYKLRKELVNLILNEISAFLWTVPLFAAEGTLLYRKVV